MLISRFRDKDSVFLWLELCRQPWRHRARSKFPPKHRAGKNRFFVFNWKIPVSARGFCWSWDLPFNSHWFKLLKWQINDVNKLRDREGFIGHFIVHVLNTRSEWDCKISFCFTSYSQFYSHFQQSEFEEQKFFFLMREFINLLI